MANSTQYPYLLQEVRRVVLIFGTKIENPEYVPQFEFIKSHRFKNPSRDECLHFMTLR
jgi:hypothetical protein